MASLDYVPAVVLLVCPAQLPPRRQLTDQGDSLTQASGPGSFHQRVAEYYTRKADVINRGFSGESLWRLHSDCLIGKGYNTEWCLPVYKAAFASKTAREAGHATPVKLMTIWLGANDSTPASSFQHVPLDKYAENLLSLIKLSQSTASPYHNPDIKIILITPPPFNPTQATATFKANNPPGAKQDPLREPEVTKQYVEACKDVAQKAGLPCIDLHQCIIDAAGGTEDRLTAAFF